MSYRLVRSAGQRSWTALPVVAWLARLVRRYRERVVLFVVLGVCGGCRCCVVGGGFPGCVVVLGGVLRLSSRRLLGAAGPVKVRGCLIAAACWIGLQVRSVGGVGRFAVLGVCGSGLVLDRVVWFEVFGLWSELVFGSLCL